MPYALNQRTFGVAPAFWMLPLSPVPHYDYDIIRQFWTGYEVTLYERAHSMPWLIPIFFGRTLWYFYLPVISALALAAAVLARRGPKVNAAFGIFACASIGLMLEKFPNAHYFAPATGAVLLLVMMGLQLLRVKAGRLALTAFAAVFFGMMALHAARLTGDEYPEREFTAHRLAALHFLAAQPGAHLVIVHYAPDHNVQDDWVYNRANIDASPVVWARDAGPAGNQELLDYYRARRVWTIEADAPGALPVPITK